MLKENDNDGIGSLQTAGQPVKRTRFVTGFTLNELLVVLIIIGVLVALAMPNFTKTRERALDKEAQTSLRLIQAAEKIYRVKVNTYYPNGGSATQADINTNLTLDLTSQSWLYGISAAGITTFTANATRINPLPNGWGRNWTITAATDPGCTDTDGGINSCP